MRYSTSHFENYTKQVSQSSYYRFISTEFQRYWNDHSCCSGLATGVNQESINRFQMFQNAAARLLVRTKTSVRTRLTALHLLLIFLEYILKFYVSHLKPLMAQGNILELLPQWAAWDSAGEIWLFTHNRLQRLLFGRLILKRPACRPLPSFKL